MSFSKKDVLEYMDSCLFSSPYFVFPNLGHGYFFPVSSKLNLFADENRWAIVFEKTGFHNRMQEITREINYYGNCLINLESYLDFDSNVKSLSLSEGDIEDFVRMSNNDCSVRINNKFHTINIDNCSGVKSLIDELDEFLVVELLRCLLVSECDALFAQEKELRLCIPKNLPKLMEIKEWHHKEYHCYDGTIEGTKPSDYETFELIATVLSSKDINLFKPTLPANNHWSFWPQSGSL